MTRQDVAAFLERLGHTVVATPTCDWFNRQRAFYQPAPPYQPVQPSPVELRRLFTRARCVGLRFPAPVTAPGHLSYVLVLEDRRYGLESLTANARSKVRRGLKQCEVRRLDPAFVRRHGRDVHADTLRRAAFEEGYAWDRYWDAVASVGGLEVWGALRGAELVAYLVAAPVGSSAEILVARSRTDALRYYPNNALLFVVLRDLLQRPQLARVVFGLAPLVRNDGADRFKTSMGFEQRPIRQRIVFHPLAGWLLRRRAVRRAVEGLLRRQRHREFCRKVEGLLALCQPAGEARS